MPECKLIKIKTLKILTLTDRFKFAINYFDFVSLVQHPALQLTFFGINLLKRLLALNLHK